MAARHRTRKRTIAKGEVAPARFALHFPLPSLNLPPKEERPTPNANWSGTETTAIVFLAGFAVQQTLQILDPLIIVSINKYKTSRPTTGLPGGLSDADFKKAIMALLSFLLGIGIVALTHIQLLALLNPKLTGIGDFFVSALVVGSGTEAVNTLLKFLGYVKDAQKPAPAVDVTIVPSTVTIKQGTTLHFTAIIANSTVGVEWKVPYSAGGNITSEGLYEGLYTAPTSPGSYQVTAFSVADKSKSAVATVTVVA